MDSDTDSASGCILKGKCLLCILGPPASITVKNPTWPAIMRVVLYTLAENSPDKKYFGLKLDIYPFIDSHWDVLCTGKTSKWHKPMQDALSHGLNLFVSGRGHHGTGSSSLLLISRHTQSDYPGFWGLKVHSDPWSNMESGGESDEAGSMVFPLSQKNETRTKRKRSKDSSETRKMRVLLLGDVKSMHKDLGKMEEQLRGIKDEFEKYKVESARGVKKFNAAKMDAEQEDLQGYRSSGTGSCARLMALGDTKSQQSPRYRNSGESNTVGFASFRINYRS